MVFAKAYKGPDVQTFPRSEQIAPSSRSTISSRKKSARELRQRRSDYRCCIPALAGFVSLRSIAPDGGKTFAQDHHPATATSAGGDENYEIRNSGAEACLFGIPASSSSFVIRASSFSPLSALTA